jgi:hypothetical protein
MAIGSLALINRISALTKLFSARKAQKITSNLLMTNGNTQYYTRAKLDGPSNPLLLTADSAVTGRHNG